MIVVEGLRKSIRNGARTVEILRGLDFSVAKGEFVAIMGASGSGKSTLLGLLAGLDTPSAGEVRLNGVAISYLPEDRLAQVRGRTVGFVFQSYQLIPTLTALENVLLSYELNAEGDGLARARQLLTSVGLGDRMDHYPVQLSGGEQQRAGVCDAAADCAGRRADGEPGHGQRRACAGAAAGAEPHGGNDAGAGDARCNADGAR
jgi:putative ABC transport system ATP-binding protein